MAMRNLLIVGLFLGWSGALVNGAEPRAGSSLGEFVPADVQFFMATQVTKERARLMQPYWQALSDLIDSGIGDDVFELATMDMSREEKGYIQAIVQRVTNLLTTPNWGELLQKEISYSFRVKGPLPLPEYLLLFRVPEGSAEERHRELKELFAGIVEMSQGALVLGDSTTKGAKVSRLEVPGSPLTVSVATRDDVVVLCTSELMLSETLGLMSGEATIGSIAKEKRFLESFKGLDGPIETRAYFNIEAYMAFFSSLVAWGEGAAYDNPELKGLLGIVKTVLGEIGRLGTVAVVDRTLGNQVVSETKVSLVAGEEPGFLESLARDQKPLEDVTRIVPKNALGFYFTNGVDPAKLYDAVAYLVKEHAPGGEQMLQEWERVQERMGFHIRGDLLTWLDGGWGSITLPPSRGGSCAECVCFLRLRDSDKAKDVLVLAFEKLQRFLASRGQAMELIDVPETEGKFKELQMAAFPWMRPVFGLPSDDVLVMGCSVSAVRRVVDAYTGEAPNFTQSKAYKALQIPDADLSEIYYTNLEGSLEGLASLLSGVGFFASILPEDRDTRHARKLGSILTKLGTFIRDVDLAAEYGGWARYDAEDRALRARSMSRVKPSKRR